MSKKSAFLWIVVALLLIPVLLWAISYHPSEFKGGLGIHDSGLFFYPRYRASVGRFPLSQSGQYKFTVRGLPPDALDLGLQLENFSENERPAVASLSTEVGVVLADGSGKEICRAEGRLSETAKG